MSTHRITRQYPGRNASEIFAKVDEMMSGMAARHGLDYRKDGAACSGAVSKMGVHGAYACRDGEVTVEVKFPMLVPHSMRRKLEEDIERRLTGLFG
jgi:hypothetical protein